MDNVVTMFGKRTPAISSILFKAKSVSTPLDGSVLRAGALIRR